MSLAVTVLTDLRRFRLYVDPGLRTKVLEEAGEVEQLEEEEEEGKSVEMLDSVLPVQSSNL